MTSSFRNSQSAQLSLRPNVWKCLCTVCGMEKNCISDPLCVHPILSVLICEPCYQYYRSGEFTQDSDGYDEQCCWCRNGGDLIVCSKRDCTYSFCNVCMERNVSDHGRKKILAAKRWDCFSCDKSQLTGRIGECQRIAEFIRVGSHRACFPMRKAKINAMKCLKKTNLQMNSLLASLEESSDNDSETPSNRSLEEEYFIREGSTSGSGYQSQPDITNGGDVAPSSDGDEDAMLVDSAEVQSEPNPGLTAKCKTAEKLFSQYIDFVRGTIAEECSQPTSQHAAELILSKLRLASLELAILRHRVPPNTGNTPDSSSARKRDANVTFTDILRLIFWSVYAVCTALVISYLYYE